MDKKAFHRISYGLYVVSSRDDDRYNGQIANTVFQVCADPPLVAVAINKENLTHEFMERSRLFSASILAEATPLKFIGLFGFRSGRDVNKFDNVHYKMGATGVPVILEHCIGYLEVKIIDTLDVITHTLFVGQVQEAQTLDDLPPLTYAHYHQVKRGRTPEKAPSYQGKR